MIPNLAAVLWIDAFTVVVVAGCCITSRRFSLYHPLVTYLLFHVVIMSGRAHAVLRGAEPLFPLGPSDFAKALLYADVGLLLFAAGVFVAIFGSGSSANTPGRLSPNKADTPANNFSNNHSYQVTLVIFLPFGLFALFKYGFITSAGYNIDQVNNWVNAAVLWPGAILMIAVFLRGFRWWNLAPLVVLLAIYGTQGGQRFRAVVLAIFLLFYLLSKTGRKWPKARFILVAVAAVSLFLPMDSLSELVQSGHFSPAQVYTIWETQNLEGLRYQRYDMMILDHLSAVIYMTDITASKLNAEPYLALLTLPYPRSLWPEKPNLAGALEYLNTTDFPLKDIGAALTLPGDFYLNFGLFGLAIAFVCVGVCMQMFYAYASRHAFSGTVGLLYLTFAAISVQVWRDGLVSAGVFMLVHFLPISFYCFVQMLFGHHVSKRKAHEKTRDYRNVKTLNGQSS